MISIIIALITSISHKITNLFSSASDTNANKKVVVVKHNTSSSSPNYVKSNNNPIIVIKPHAGTESPVLLATVKNPMPVESGQIRVITAHNGIESNNNVAIKNADNIAKIDASNVDETPSGLSEYDNYAKNINDLKHQIELNKLQAEVYKSQINYEEPGSYDNATMIGVVIDHNGYKSAKIKLIDDSVTDLMIGSRLGSYVVSAITINEVVLIGSNCKKSKRHHHRKNNTETKDLGQNDLSCKPVKIYPLYRDINNKLPTNSNKSISTSSADNVTRSSGATTSINSGGMTLSIPPIEAGSRGN